MVLKNLFLIAIVFIPISAFSQFNTVYSTPTKQAEIKASKDASKTGNVFLDKLSENTEKTEPKKKEKKAKNKKEKNQFSFKDSLEYYSNLKKNKIEIEPSRKPTIKKDVFSDYNSTEDFHSENNDMEDIVYKTLPLIHKDEVSIKKFSKIRQVVFMPLAKMKITSDYGLRIHPVSAKAKMHNGIDLRANYDNVYSILKGKVLVSGYSASNGNYVVVQHQYYTSYYLHLSTILVLPDTYVDAGTLIGISGNTGTSTAPHLHFAVKEDGKFINPLKFLNDLIIANNTISTYGNNKQNSTGSFN